MFMSGKEAVKRRCRPNEWQGETDCLVGPFSFQVSAETYGSRLVNAFDTGKRVKLL